MDFITIISLDALQIFSPDEAWWPSSGKNTGMIPETVLRKLAKGLLAWYFNQWKEEPGQKTEIFIPPNYARASRQV